MSNEENDDLIPIPKWAAILCHALTDETVQAAIDHFGSIEATIKEMDRIVRKALNEDEDNETI